MEYSPVAMAIAQVIFCLLGVLLVALLLAVFYLLLRGYLRSISHYHAHGPVYQRWDDDTFYIIDDD